MTGTDQVNRVCQLNLFSIFLQIVGHSLGGGTAALLTYILREQQGFSSATCVAFAPGSFQFNSLDPFRVVIFIFNFFISKIAN